MERIVERPGALDVHKESMTACVRVWEGRELEEQMAEFRTTVQGLLALRDWLEALGVKQVVMEATGVYWKPVWAILEDRFELMLVNARHVKAVPGRKTDIKDAQWLCQLLEAGLLKASFVPPKPIRTSTEPDEAADRLRELRRSVPSEVVVVEPAHPLAGRMLAVEGQRTVRGERCLLVRLPDGSAAAVALSATSVSGRGAPAGGGALLSPAGVRRLRALLIVVGGDHPGA